MTLKCQTLRQNTLLLLIILDILDEKIKQKKLVNESNNLVNHFDLSTKIAALAPKAELKAEQDKIEKLQTYGLSHFLGKYFFDENGFQNMLFYQPTVDTLELKKDNDTHHVLSWKSKWA